MKDKKLLLLRSSSPVKDAALSRPKLGFKSRSEHFAIGIMDGAKTRSLETALFCRLGLRLFGVNADIAAVSYLYRLGPLDLELDQRNFEFVLLSFHCLWFRFWRLCSWCGRSSLRLRRRRSLGRRLHRGWCLGRSGCGRLWRRGGWRRLLCRILGSIRILYVRPRVPIAVILRSAQIPNSHLTTGQPSCDVMPSP